MLMGKEEAESILQRLSKTIKYYARMYEGHGAERDDLIQEGFLAALRLMKRCSRENLDRAFYCSLRGMVRDAAERLRHQARTLHMSRYADDGEASSWMEEVVTDGAAADAAENIELMYDLDRSLGAEARKMALMLLEGYTQSEIAFELEISQQAASKRIGKIRSVLQHLKERH